MLKVIYTETGQHLEHVSSSLASWLSRQCYLAQQTGYGIHIEACTASILLPDQPSVMTILQSIQSHDAKQSLTWGRADAATIEVIIAGVWAADGADCEEGAFLADLGDRTVNTLVHLWAQAVLSQSAIGDGVSYHHQ